MAPKPVFAAVFTLLVHVFTSSNHAVRHLEHPRVKIYTIYTFYTAINKVLQLPQRQNRNLVNNERK